MGVLETRLPQHLGLRRSSLTHTDATSVAIAAAGLLNGLLIITIIIFRSRRGIVSNDTGSWRQVGSSRSSHEFSVDHLLIQCLLFFIGVIEDNDLAITRWPEDVAVEVTKKFLGELRVTRSVSDEVFLIEDKERSIIRVFLKEPPCSNTGEQGDMRRSPTGTLVVVEIQMASAAEPWRRWVKDFPLRRESAHV
jgi:hypothetical protein